MTLAELLQRDDVATLLYCGRVTFLDGATTITVRQVVATLPGRWWLLCVRPNGAMPPLHRDGGFELMVEGIHRESPEGHDS